MNNKINGILAFALILLVVFGCDVKRNARHEEKPPKEYWGYWDGDDGSRLTIFYSGLVTIEKGDYRFDGNIFFDREGKSFVLRGKTEKEFTIEQPPRNGKMKINGVVYTAEPKENFPFGTPAPNAVKNAPPTQNAPSVETDELPQPAELQELSHKTMTMFYYSIVDDEATFDSLRGIGSRGFRDNNPTEKLREKYAEFANNPQKYSPIFQATIHQNYIYDGYPYVEKVNGKSVLNLEGYYPTGPQLYFRAKYEKEKMQLPNENQPRDFWFLSALEIETR